PTLQKRRQHTHPQGRHVKHRRNHQRHFMVANIHIGDHIDSVPCEIAVAEHGTFRIAGRARSVKNNGQIVYTNANVWPISTRAIQDGSILLHRDVWLFSSGRLMGAVVNEDYPLNSRTPYTSNGKW